ncbi:ty1-copia retrotransposon protein [Tanacetum coccineum]
MVEHSAEGQSSNAQAVQAVVDGNIQESCVSYVFRNGNSKGYKKDKRKNDRRQREVEYLLLKLGLWSRSSRGLAYKTVSNLVHRAVIARCRSGAAIRQAMMVNEIAVTMGQNVVLGNSESADIKNQWYVGKGYAVDERFKINVMVDQEMISIKMNSSAYLIESSNVWHGRLGHRCVQKHGIRHEFTAPYSPQQNGIAERKNRTLKEMVTAMLISSGMSQDMWGEAILTATYLLNKIPRKEKEETPYEFLDIREKTLFYPSILKSVGCLAKVACAIIQGPKKIGPKSVDCIFIGYAKKSTAYRFIVHESKNPDIQKNTIMESRNASFFENIFPCLSKGTGSSSNKRESESRPRRSKRARNEKSFGPDFVSFMVENEPTSYEEAGNFSDGQQLERSLKKMMKGLVTLTNIKARVVIQGNMEIHQMDVGKRLLSNGDFRRRKSILNQLGVQAPGQEGKDKVWICTRPDLAYAVSRLSRYTSNPSYAHWKAITRVLHYLRYSRDYGLHYDRHPAVIEGYSDANWISDIKDSRSTSGYVFTLGGAAISWKSSKQTVIAKSTMESEFMAR